MLDLLVASVVKKMDPYNEEWLREEVIYLHSLWHKGPPTPRSRHPHPNQPPPPPEDSGIEWPCQPVSVPCPTDPSGWPVFTKKQHNPEPKHPSSSSQQQPDWFIANQSQSKALKAVNEFFKSMNSDSDSDDDEEEEEVENENQVAEWVFFSKLFREDNELREFYKRDYENGKFTCLVCSGLGKYKRFNDCAALVQHTIAIAKKKKAHITYGQVICNVLGWDILKISSTVSKMTEKSNLLLNKSYGDEEETQANSKKVSKNIASNEEITGVESVGAENIPDNGDKEEENCGNESAEGEKLPSNGESEVSEGPRFVPDPNGGAEDLGKGVAEGVQDDTERAR